MGQILSKLGHMCNFEVVIWEPEQCDCDFFLDEFHPVLQKEEYIFLSDPHKKIITIVN